jgi:hypothetical protein
MIPKSLSPLDEFAFQVWYADISRRAGLNPNPDDPRHMYDYREAWRHAARPDLTGHWPSEYKTSGHPREYLPVQGSGVLNTKKNEMVNIPWAEILKGQK